MKKSLIIFLTIFTVIGCNSALLEKPSYKPINRANYKAVELWQASNQYQMASVLQNFGKLEISFGNNGTILPESKFSNMYFPGYGLSMVLEIKNNSDSQTIIDLYNSNIKDANGYIWKIIKCEEVIETNRMNSSMKLTPVEDNNKLNEIHSNNYKVNYNGNELVRFESSSTKNLFIYFTSNYDKYEVLPEELTLSLQSINSNSKTTNQFKFNKIDWNK